jgi:thioredoxin-like negative regulator of GroEL
VDKKKYLVAAIGLAVGFIVSFYFTSKINRENASASAAAAPQQQAAAAPEGHGGQAGGMGNIPEVIAKARSNPKDFDAQVEAASAFAQIGRDDGALEFLEKAYDADSTKFARLNGAATFLGEVYMKQNKYDDAEKWFKRAIDINAKDAEAMVHLVEARAMKKDARGAEEALGRLKQADPTNARVAGLETMVADVKAGKPVTPAAH